MLSQNTLTDTSNHLKIVNVLYHSDTVKQIFITLIVTNL